MTKEQFLEACDGLLREFQVTEEILKVSSGIKKADAAEAVNLSGSGWKENSVVKFIESELGSQKDRVIQAILEAASKFGA